MSTVQVDTTIHVTGESSFVVNESHMQARNKFRMAVSNGNAVVRFTLSNGSDLDIATSHIVAIEGLESPSAMAEKYKQEHR